jgi:selenocysteine-specific elongation factor
VAAEDAQAVRHVIIGTAGHVDHGKTTLIRALTGTDTDRLAEEKARGMTIDLGFAHLRLPPPAPDAPGLEAGIVDVPGHERFVKNMLAGAGGVDVALVVVAADEGPMPQTREHLDILTILGVGQGVVALTKADLADVDLRALAADATREALESTPLAGAPIVPVSVPVSARIRVVFP